MQPDWRRQARKAAAGLLFHSRLITFLSHLGSERRFILAYHRVVSEGSDDLSFVQPGMYVTGNTFEMHIRYLCDHYHVLPLEDLISRQEGDACAITFDDGWRDNYVTAFPILRAHAVPATIFLATNLVGTTRWPWPDRVCFYIHRASPTDFCDAFESAWRRDTGEPLDITIGPGDRFAVAEVVLRRLKRLEHGLLRRLVAGLDDRFRDLDSALRTERPWLTWDDVLEMGQHGISFGSHTENHVILPNVPPAEARAEIVNSGTVLAAKIGTPTATFCYPNGSYSPEVVRMVADAGYRCAVTTRRGTLESSAGPFELRRIMLHEDISNTPALFACALAGLSGFRHVWHAGSKGSP